MYLNKPPFELNGITFESQIPDDSGHLTLLYPERVYGITNEDIPSHAIRNTAFDDDCDIILNDYLLTPWYNDKEMFKLISHFSKYLGCRRILYSIDLGYLGKVYNFNFYKS
uniref:Uncharacterized protein n=1 Tax=viral metagenome TaxID=1070528 RepID=A0A6C0CJM4_9ZZZZ